MSTLFQVAPRRVLVPAIHRYTVMKSISRRSMMSFGEKARLKGKVEEDRYLKVQEEQWLEKLRALKSQEETDRKQKHHDEVIDPVKKDIKDMLSKTGDVISDEGLENLAKFRLDL